MKNKLSQNKLILSYLQTGKGITAMKALQKFHCFRLASRINDLRNEGHKIKGALIKTDYTKKTISEYRLICS